MSSLVVYMCDEFLHSLCVRRQEVTILSHLGCGHVPAASRQRLHTDHSSLRSLPFIRTHSTLASPHCCNHQLAYSGVVAVTWRQERYYGVLQRLWRVGIVERTRFVYQHRCKQSENASPRDWPTSSELLNETVSSCSSCLPLSDAGLKGYKRSWPQYTSDRSSLWQHL
jgi:hypothetical protein